MSAKRIIDPSELADVRARCRLLRERLAHDVESDALADSLLSGVLAGQHFLLVGVAGLSKALIPALLALPASNRARAPR